MFSEFANNLQKKLIPHVHYNKVSREKIDEYLELSSFFPIFAIDM
jgi:hypothetical protein